MLVLALVVANDIHPQPLWLLMYVLSGLFFGGLFVWDRKSPQSYDIEQDSVEVGDETPSRLKSPEQTSDEDVDRQTTATNYTCSFVSPTSFPGGTDIVTVNKAMAPSSSAFTKRSRLNSGSNFTRYRNKQQSVTATNHLTQRLSCRQKPTSITTSSSLMSEAKFLCFLFRHGYSLFISAICHFLLFKGVEHTS